MQEQQWQIEAYISKRDAAAAFQLWQEELSQSWPIDFQRFEQILASPHAHHVVVRRQEQLIGFAATSHSPSHGLEVGYLQALIVASTWQHKGLGSALQEYTLNHLHSAGAEILRLGGHSPRFWCGVPANLPDALAFFESHGWQFQETVYDLTQDLSQYITPPKVNQRALEQGITFYSANKEDIPDILAFEGREFPNWLPHYQHLARLGEERDILVARDGTGQVVGTLLMSTPQSHPQRTDVVWRILLGADAGSMGAVGVASSEQGRGIGLALVARASEILKARGVRTCYIDWVVLTDFYARLGYQPWRAFQMSARDFL